MHKPSSLAPPPAHYSPRAPPPSFLGSSIGVPNAWEQLLQHDRPDHAAVASCKAQSSRVVSTRIRARQHICCTTDECSHLVLFRLARHRTEVVLTPLAFVEREYKIGRSMWCMVDCLEVMHGRWQSRACSLVTARGGFNRWATWVWRWSPRPPGKQRQWRGEVRRRGAGAPPRRRASLRPKPTAATNYGFSFLLNARTEWSMPFSFIS
jgi:hypothetical protein